MALCSRDAGPMREAIMGAIATFFRDVARLVVPVECPGCGLDDVLWCEECVALWWEEPFRCETSAPRLVRSDVIIPAWSVATLEGPVHAMISAWKDGGRRDLDAVMTAAVARAALTLSGDLPSTLSVVPAPSRPGSARRRGADLTRELAQAVATALRGCGIDARVTRALTIGAGEQRGAGARERWSSASSVKVSSTVRDGVPILVVDDVLTTGATVASAVAALSTATHPVIGALVLASAHAPGATRVTRAGSDRGTGLW